MKTKTMIISAFSLCAFFIGLMNFSAMAQTVKDVDGNKYNTVTINTQLWMTENLNVTRFLNGDSILQTKTPEEWVKAYTEGKPAWCYYNNDTANGKIYGKLYNWFAITDSRGLAPKGWHVPTSSDWTTLVKYLGNVNAAGVKLKSIIGWKMKGNNKSGFNGLPGGLCTPKGIFADINEKGQWWSNTVNFGDLTKVHSIMLINSKVEAFFIQVTKDYGLSVRCIKD